MQELTLVSHLVKNLVERANKDEDGEVTIEEIVTFNDFEFIENAFPAVLELGEPGSSVGYLVSSHLLAVCTILLSWIQLLRSCF